jgi:hypothetical protein
MTEWKRHPDKEGFVSDVLKKIRSADNGIDRFLRGLTEGTHTRLEDWIDHIRVGEVDLPSPEKFGMEPSSKLHEMGDVWIFERTNLPPFVISKKGYGLSIKVEDIDLFITANGLDSKVHGSRNSPFRYSHFLKSDNVDLYAVERRGYDGFQSEEGDNTEYLEFRKEMVVRERDLENDIESLKDLERSVARAVTRIGKTRTADAFFWVERRNWESRNMLALLQLEKQNRFGLGWGNHDHHTFRCSRESYRRTISVLEMMGLEPRERFYAGEQAGWGAQVLESKEAGIVVFADVDLSPEEKEGDFAHEGLEPAGDVGTVGLWVKLHGESILSAGLHHIAVLSDFGRMVTMGGIPTMKPFSNFSYLKQCFTEGERWNVLKKRGLELSAQNLITDEQFERFTRSGALGSHLEFIERRDGFKGFNQSAVSDIITRTDPRRS